MKRLAASIASSILGLIGIWALELQRRVQVWAGHDDDLYRWGGTD